MDYCRLYPPKDCYELTYTDLAAAVESRFTSTSVGSPGVQTEGIAVTATLLGFTTLIYCNNVKIIIRYVGMCGHFYCRTITFIC